MTQAFWKPESSRKILKRIIVEGVLTLQTPASFSNGDTEDLVDIPLLTDTVEPNRPLLTGASLAGALRAYLYGFGNKYAEELLGGNHSDNEGDQSHLIVEDAIGIARAIEFRDGVKIDPKSRTAVDKALYNREVWSAGTTFDLSLELLVCEPSENHQSYAPESELRTALATALAGINSGAITFGGRKTRGYGRANVAKWTVKTYDLAEAADLKAWIRQHEDPQPQPKSVLSDKNIKTALGVDNLLPDTRPYFEIKATFALESSLLIRTEGVGKYDPDVIHLRNGSDQPLLSGTSLAGALRARAAKIAKTLKPGSEQIAEQMFGADMTAMRERNKLLPAGQKEKPYGSRVRVTEQVITNAAARLVQNRVSIDRFTGGALETALFNEEPVFSHPGREGVEGTCVGLTISLKKPEKYEVGLLLHLLKDLWTQDLPLGGESSVGRGRLRGIQADIRHQGTDGGSGKWHLREVKGALRITENAPESSAKEKDEGADALKEPAVLRAELEEFARAFTEWTRASQSDTTAKRKEVNPNGN